MQVKVKAEPISEIMTTKKGGYIRKYLVEVDGVKEVVTQYSDDKTTLEKTGVHERIMVTGGFFFSPKK